MLRELEYQPPSSFYWLKVGVAFTVGAWLAGVLLFLPSIYLWLAFATAFLRALARVH